MDFIHRYFFIYYPKAVSPRPAYIANAREDTRMGE